MSIEQNYEIGIQEQNYVKYNADNHTDNHTDNHADNHADNHEVEAFKQKVEQVYLEYRENKHILYKLKQIIDNLDITLKMEETNRQKKIEKATEIWQEQHKFMEKLFIQNELSYLHNNNLFFILDNNCFKLIKEDDLQHQILSNLTNEPLLSQYKYKTKSFIIKKIKERHLFSQTPPKSVIEEVTTFFNNELFNNNSKTIYFLCVLGDFLLKKNNTNIIFINNALKRVILLIDEVVFNKNDFMPNINNISFITKYHENQDRSKYKLLFSKASILYDKIKDFLQVNSINFLVVCSYYSSIIELNNSHVENLDNSIIEKVNFLANHDNEFIIDLFISQCVEKGDKEHDFYIPWKNMHYIWKLFLEQNEIPNMMYSAQLKEMLKEKITFDEKTENFLYITSKYLPRISSFMQFWGKNMYIFENEKEFLFELDIYDLDIEELVMLYKYNTNSYLCETEMTNIMNHFFTTQLIIENKCILNVKCYLWNKFQDVSVFFECLKISDTLFTDCLTIHIDELYQHYCSNIQNSNKFVVSKLYFEKYIHNILSDYILSKHEFLYAKWLKN